MREVRSKAELQAAISAAAGAGRRRSLVFGSGMAAAADRQVAESHARLGDLHRESQTPVDKRAVETITVRPLDKDAESAVREYRRGLRIREALRAQDATASKTTNESLHVVDTPGGVAAYHRERQKTALGLAAELRGGDRKFALKLAREHGQAKRSASSNQQPRVPAGSSDGGQWTRR